MDVSCVGCGRAFPLAELDVVEDGYRCAACGLAAEQEARRAAAPPPEQPDPPRTRFEALFLVPAAALLLWWIASERVVMICHRAPAAAQCELSERHLFGSQTRRIPLDQIRGAALHEENDVDGKMYWIEVYTTGGETIVLGPRSSVRAASSPAIEELEQFLADRTQPSLETQTGGATWILVWGGGALILTIVFVREVRRRARRRSL